MSKIKVTIQAKKLLHYEQEVEMEEADYEKVKHLTYDDVNQWLKPDKEAYNIIDKYLNYSDVVDSDDEFKDVSVSLSK